MRKRDMPDEPSGGRLSDEELLFDDEEFGEETPRAGQKTADRVGETAEETRAKTTGMREKRGNQPR